MLPAILALLTVAVTLFVWSYVRRPRGDYDIVVIGGGSAGLTAAGFSASLGARTLLVERERLGGECTWSGCIPSKALLKAAKVAQAMRTAAKYGIDGSAPDVDLGRVMDRVRDIQEHVFRDADAPEIMSGFGVEIALGSARFVGRDMIEIHGGSGSEGSPARRVRFRDAFVCTGTRARVPDIPGLADVAYVTNETVFALPTLPRSLVVLGGGPVGVELAQAFARLGSSVTVVTRDREILPKEAPDLAAVVRESLERENVRFLLGSELAAVERAGEAHQAVIAGSSERVTFDAILVAVGRVPNVESLALDVACVTTTADGIVVDGRCRTSNRRVYACGDVTGRLLFTHYAEHMAKVAVANAVLGVPLRLERGVVPRVTFTDPELAHVGVGRNHPRRARTYRFPYSKVDRAVAERDDAGWLHVHTDRRGRVLGATIVGTGAGEVIAELALAIKHRLTLRKIADTIHAYPTLALGARRVADQWYVQATSPMLLRAAMALRGLRGKPPRKRGPDEIV